VSTRTRVPLSTALAENSDMFLSVINLQPLPATGIAKGERTRRYADIGNRAEPVDQGQGASPGSRGRPLSRVCREGRGLRCPEAAEETTVETFWPRPETPNII
jgi:hypothetical protein